MTESPRSTSSCPAPMRLFAATRLLRVFVFLLIAPAALAQHVDFRSMSDRALLDHLRAHRAAVRDGAAMPGVALDGERHTEKCSIHLMAELAHRGAAMAPADREELRELLAPPFTQTSILSRSGRFRVHYDTTGRHTPAMLDASNERIAGTYHEYADSVAAALDHAFAMETGVAGFDDPPFSAGSGTNNVYLQEYNGGFYGETFFPTPAPPSGTVMPTYLTYMQMDNDYREFYSRGLNGARVTAAHEFHHVIQLGRYGVWSGDIWMYEMTSTFFEEFVYPEVNDYFIYMKDFMNNTDRPFYAWGDDGYELSLWPMHLTRRYGPRIMRDIWEGMKQREAIVSMRDGLSVNGGDFSTDFCDWARVNHATAWRSPEPARREYEDAPLLPSVKFHASLEFIGGLARINGMLQPLSSQYSRVARGLDTVSFVVSNVDIAAAMNRSGNAIAYEIEVRDNAPGVEGFQPLSNGWYYRFTAAVSNVLCMQVLDSGAVVTTVERQVFPNPLLLKESSRLHFPLPRNTQSNRAELVIYTTSMNEVYRRADIPVELSDMMGAFVSWDVLADGANVGSGVYFYVLTVGGERRVGKFAIIGG